ncbi:hypothetical protein D9619_001554 [Psilocybe cf. subviscida]|uniref:RING-type domain-containing protein n=1 Tax=Psilocybe cf. subviscida TaxID=2480587 RepID=A0A8H5BGZ1_9AGAR|nr:hypothetical protein D9619_001554 [Psilocybe cf. subviscida]
MSLYNYVDTPNANLICCICRAPFTDPATSLTCSHTFCGDCIARALSHSPTCPVDRTPLRPTDLVPANPIVRSLVDELVVECVYRGEGCSYTAQRQIMPQHLRDACLFAEVTCEETLPGDEDDDERLCNKRIRRKDLLGHRRKVHGREEATENVQEGREGEHVQQEGAGEAGSDGVHVNSKTEDHEETNYCPHTSLGCPYTGPLSPSQHLLYCPYESLKGFFSLNAAKTAADTSKIALLTEQNLILRHKVDTLEGTLQVLKREMGATKQALGPWFRSAYASTPHGTSRSAGAGPSSPGSDVNMSASGSRRDAHAYQHESRRSIGDMHTGAGMRMTPAGHDTTGIGEIFADRLASYFPSLPGTDTPGQPQLQLQQHALAGPPTSASTNANFIAPLDLSSPLEGTLGGLHASIGGLAAGVDALGRRSELALANETLRMGEEMMSVRAQMHGLRMQVHGMMMDRNAAFGGGFGAGGVAGGVGFINHMGVNNVAAGPSAPPREEGQFRMGMGFVGPPSITKL